MKGIGLQGIGIRRRRMMMGRATIPWYLSGGIPLVNCRGAYQIQGAADLAASQINVAHPGIHDLVPIGPNISFDPILGWGFSQLDTFDTGLVPESTWSMILRFGFAYYGIYAGVASDNTFPSPEIDFYMGSNTTTGFSEYHVGLNQTDGTTLFAFPGTLGVAQYQGYANGLPDAPPAVPYVWSAADCLYSIHLGGYNAFGIPVIMSGFLLDYAVYDITLIDAQMLAISNAMLTL